MRERGDKVSDISLPVGNVSTLYSLVLRARSMESPARAQSCRTSYYSLRLQSRVQEYHHTTRATCFAIPILQLCTWLLQSSFGFSFITLVRVTVAWRCVIIQQYLCITISYFRYDFKSLEYKYHTAKETEAHSGTSTPRNSAHRMNMCVQSIRST